MGGNSSSAVAAKPRFKIGIQPTKKVKLGKRSCFTGRVTLRGKGVVARVDLEGKATRSNRKGRFRLCQVLQWGGYHAAYAFRGDWVTHNRFHIGGSHAPRDSKWYRMDIQIPAYESSRPYPGGCQSRRTPFGVDHGGCLGWTNKVDDGGWFANYKHVYFSWDDRNKPTSLSIRLYQERDPEKLPEIWGWIDGPDARIFHPTGGYLNPIWNWRMGSDPEKVGQPGGPWLLKVAPHEDGSQPDGMTFHVIGYAKLFANPGLPRSN